ncbi:MAG: DNA ligase, partial [archaeon]|nr:DNA ligase [archaeon]
MLYSKLCEIYEKLSSTTKGLEKTTIIADFLKNIIKEPETIYLLQGKFFPDYDERESGISEQLAIKAISKAAGTKEEQIVKEFKKTGDLGLTAEIFSNKKKQSSLFSEKLTTQKVLENLRKLPSIEGKGAVDRKIGTIIELLNSASSTESKYIIRTLLGDLKVGIGSGLLRDSIVEFAFHPENIEEKKKKGEILQNAYDKVTDFAEVFEKAMKGEKELNKIELSPGKPVKVMLFPKAKNVDDAFKIVGKPAAFEYKYDGFRMMINK